jgi:hypothetical protein
MTNFRQLKTLPCDNHAMIRHCLHLPSVISILAEVTIRRQSVVIFSTQEDFASAEKSTLGFLLLYT